MTTTPIRLDRQAYTDTGWQDRETDHVFNSSWQLAGVVSDWAGTGDYRTLRFGNQTLLVIRDAHGDLQAFHNVCRHRGSTLKDACGNDGQTIVCPYHNWTYGLDGQLRGVPDREACFPGLRREALGLKPGSVGVFNGLVFVTGDANASLHDWLGPVRENAWPHDLSPGSRQPLHEQAPLTYDIKCNWKIFVENAIDGYHLAHLHAATLGGPLPAENLWQKHGLHLIWFAQDGETDIRYPLPKQARREYADAGLAPLPGIPDNGYGGVYLLFPNILITTSPYDFSIATLKPVVPDRCHLEIRTWAGQGTPAMNPADVPGFDPATGLITSDSWTAHPRDTGDFQTEDVWICEKVQQGMQSPAYEPGPLAGGAGAEDAIRWFQDSVLDAMR